MQFSLINSISQFSIDGLFVYNSVSKNKKNTASMVPQEFDIVVMTDNKTVIYK